jgi:hypothetical protein
MVILEATGLALSLLEAMHCIKMCTGADALMREREHWEGKQKMFRKLEKSSVALVEVSIERCKRFSILQVSRAAP